MGGLVETGDNLDRLAPDVEAIRAQLPEAQDLTDLQLLASLALVQTGSVDGAAALLGIERKKFEGKLRIRKVAGFVAFLTTMEIQTAGVAIALKTLQNVALDTGQTGASRVRAAEAILKWNDDIEQKRLVRGASSQKPISEMTVNELTDLVAKLEDAQDREAQTIDVTPEDREESKG